MMERVKVAIYNKAVEDAFLINHVRYGAFSIQFLLLTHLLSQNFSYANLSESHGEQNTACRKESYEVSTHTSSLL